MTRTTPQRFAVLTALLATLLAVPLCAQGKQDKIVDLDAAEVVVKKNAIRILMRFASTAKSRKFGPKEKEAYERIIAGYDSEDKRARRSLNYKFDRKEKEWKLIAPKKRRKWVDKADRKGRFQVQQEWRKTRMKLCAEHRNLGLKMLEAGGAFAARGKRHVRRAIGYNPMDEAAHVALGHKPTDVNGITYHGNDQEIAFIKRMKEIETKALMLSKKTYDPQPVEEIPAELKKLGLEIHGAKTENHTVFVRGTQENANDVVQWGERALDFIDYLVGDDSRTKRRARLRMRTWKWRAYLWTKPEFEQFMMANPKLFKDRLGSYRNISFPSGKKTCEVFFINMPSSMHDNLITQTFHYGLGGGHVNNLGLLEGIHHAATWFLKSTCASKFGAEPKGTVSSVKKQLPEGANWWLREMRNQAIAGTDVPLNVVPRTELSNFPADVRLKTWSFAVWVMARYPKEWLEFARACPHDKIPFPSEVDEIGAKVFGKPLTEVEDDWREWASGRGVVAAATGYGPPLLPEFPNKTELDGLERLNAVRRAVTCWAVPTKGGAKKPGGKGTKAPTIIAPPNQWNKVLPECELDSEATAACKDHAMFFGKHEEHWKWPEAHEEDPAKEGFTPRGMRAGLRSVIIWSNGTMDAVGAVDGWIGTVYHRFPLLEYNIKRFGIAYDNTGKCEVVVLDMGSLQEPTNQELEVACGLIAWPPHEMKNVPRQFSYTEHPNPLEDVGIDFDGQKQTGYPVSLQFSKLAIINTKSCTMSLYEAKKRGGTYITGDEVPCWLHTPDEPLLKRMVMRNVVFVIPKAVLKPKTVYKAVVRMNIAGVDKTYEWAFTTGSQMQDLGKLK